MNLKLSTENIKAKALELGFSACGIAQAKAVDEQTKTQLSNWIAHSHHADMHYMANHFDKRTNPTLLMPGVKSIVVVALNYAPQHRIAAHQWQIATYAYGQDYHDVVKNMLRQLAKSFGLTEDFAHNSQPNHAPQHHKTTANTGLYRAFCDTAPILERYWAVQAGLGWIGKNHQLIVPQAGSMFVLGELFLDIALDYDTPQPNRCGKCQACIKACPTQALCPEGALDARKCLSYITIENKNNIPNDIIPKLNNQIYGCDQCLDACPWNRFATPTTIEALQTKPQLLAMTKEDWLNLSVEEYQKIFQKSAVKRAKYSGLMRNIQAAASQNIENKEQK